MTTEQTVRSPFIDLDLFPLGLRITGIEVTQATQFLDSDQHLTDPPDRQPDNAVRLVADKPAWVRVYLRSLFGGSGVTGSLVLSRRVLGLFYLPVATLAPHSSSTTTVPNMFNATYAGTRGAIGATLNFVIPAGQMIGHLRLAVRASMGTLTAESTIDVGVTLRQTLRFAGVMISYNGPSSMASGSPTLSLPAPTLADLQNMSGTALTLFPVRSAAAFRTAGSLVQTVPLQDTTFPTSGCGAAWDALHARVINARTADGNQPGWIYYGLLPAGTPMGPVGGCGGSGVAVGPTNDPLTLAHEAGHAAGLRHAPSGGAPNPDPAYPAYEPYDPAGTPQGSIGEYGLDVNNGNVASPATFRDIMGYANPKWISPYHYGRLVNNALLNPVTVGVDNLWWRGVARDQVRARLGATLPELSEKTELELPVHPPSLPADVISVIARVQDGRIAEVTHITRTTAHTDLPGATPTPFTVQLRDAGGAVIASGALQRLSPAACGCGGGRDGEPSTRYVAQAFLPDVAPGARLEIVADDEVVWSRSAPPEPPRMNVAAPRITRKGNVRLQWDAGGDVTEYWLRWSPDGRTWRSVATEVTGTTLRMAPGQLPPGDGFLQLVAHDGFHSVASEAMPVSVPEPGVQLAVLHPVQDNTYAAGQEIRLLASAIGPADTIVWTIDGREVGTGLDTWAALEAGDHRVGVRSGDAEASVTVTAVPVEPPSEA